MKGGSRFDKIRHNTNIRVQQAKLRSKCKEDSQENEYDRSLFIRITDFPYVPTAIPTVLY